ncbi:MAG: DsrE family protein [Mariniphaga sp.]|nr:DsrE family protein [Mariniphaga sp.]
MKKAIFSLTVILLFLAYSISAQEQFNPQPQKKKHSPTSIGMVIYSNDVETVWNAFRLANHSKNQGDTVQIFLLAKGVEVDNLVKENKDLKEQVDAFLGKGGQIQGCGTCLQSRNMDGPQICTFSSLADLYAVIRKNKIVLTF